MDDKNSKLKNSISAILPDYDDSDPNQSVDYEEVIDQEIEAEQQRLSAADLARIKLKEKHALESKKAKSEQERQQIAQNIAEIEVLQDSPAAQRFLAGGESDLSPYAGTTRRDVVKLLSGLNINMSLYLTRADTYNLLSCLLTCNENQLDAIYKNPKVPLAIKIVIKRLKEDAKLGNIDTLERLWDRVFGKNQTAAAIQLPEGVSQGLLPNTLVSREAYMIIRDTIIGNQG